MGTKDDLLRQLDEIKELIQARDFSEAQLAFLSKFFRVQTAAIHRRNLNAQDLIDFDKEAWQAITAEESVR